MAAPLDPRKEGANRLREAAVVERRAAQRYQNEGAPERSWRPYIDRAEAWEEAARLLEAGSG